jgi:hypothetical protein
VLGSMIRPRVAHTSEASVGCRFLCAICMGCGVGRKQAPTVT